VETADVAEWLRREKVDMMQGYFFGKPSLDRPWVKPAEMAPTKPAEYFGGNPVVANAGEPTTVRTTSVS
jgi:hypothetical protein